MKIPCKIIFKTYFYLSIFITISLQAQQLTLTNQTIATVGEHRITVKDFSARCNDYILSTGIKDNIVLRESILNNMINEILLFFYDNNDKVFSDKEYQRELKWAEKQTILAYLTDQEVYAKISVTDAEIREAYYRSNEKISARHLYAQSEEEANNLYQLLQTGATFDVLAKQVFSDSTLQNNGGYLGYFSWGDMDPAFEDAAFALKVGEISKPVKTRNGYSIIKLEDRVVNPLLTEDEYARKKHHMESVVRLRKRSSSEQEYIRKHFNPGKLLFNEKSLGPVLDNLTSPEGIPNELNRNKISSQPCVKYLSKTYKQDEIARRIANIPAFHRKNISSIEKLKSAIAGLVLQDILTGIAAQKGYGKVAAVKSIITKYKNVIYLAYKRKIISENATLSDSTVRKFYDDNKNYFKAPNEINVQEILVKDKSAADKLAEQIRNGSDFGSLAEKFSLREWSARNKGIMGFAEASKYGILKDTLWNSSLNDVIGPVKIQDVFGIFKVLGKKEGPVRDFEEVKTIAEDYAKKEKSSFIVEKYVEGLKSRVKIQIDKQILGNVILDN